MNNFQVIIKDIMKLQTPVIEEKCKVSISYQDRILMLGSCFSDNIGQQLRNFGFDVCINPFGTLYNPVSILNSLRRLSEGKGISKEDIVQIGAGDTRWCSFFHHTSFSAETPEDFLLKASEALKTAHDYFNNCTRLIITLGTSWCYRHNDTGLIVSNCLKHPGQEFTRERLDIKETSETLLEIIRTCAGCSVPKKIIFTVSPIRHFKDGAHGNQLSKSTLLLGIDEALALTDNESADYFPAYEIVMDELRDYRFYAEDMCHPSAQTVNHIRERFLNWALPQDEHTRLQENIRSYLHASHHTRNIAE